MRPDHSSFTRRVERFGIVRIGRQRRVQRLACLVLLAERREADAVVAEQARIARQAAQRVLVQLPCLGCPVRDRPARGRDWSAPADRRSPAARRASTPAAPPRNASGPAGQPWLLRARTSSGAWLEAGLQHLQGLVELLLLDMEERELQDSIAVRRVCRKARCRTSTASPSLPGAAWASARVFSAATKPGSISSARWTGPRRRRPAGMVEHEAQHVIERGAVGGDSSAWPASAIASS